MIAALKAATKSQGNSKGIPSWAKGALVLAGIGLGAYLVIKLNKTSKEAKQTTAGKDEANTAGKELAGLMAKGVNPTISPAQAKIYANSIFQAMDGYASDEQAVYKVFVNCKNDADVLAIISAFGVREISSGALNPEPNYKGALGGALTSELSANEIMVLNSLLAKKGIKYKF